MIRHCVMLTYAAEASEEAKAAVLAGLAELPDKISEIANYSFGPDALISEGNHDLVVIGDFDSVEDYLAYARHPDHLALIADVIKPILSGRAAVQYELD